MTAQRGRSAGLHNLPEPRRQRVRDWCNDLEAIQSLIEFRLGLRRQTGPLAPSSFHVLLFNAWDTGGLWIPPGRLDLAGEYLEARLRGVATGSAQRGLLIALSVPTSQATPEQRELALDIQATFSGDRAGC